MSTHLVIDIESLVKKYNRIGLVDSGIGGISVLSPLTESLHADFIYLADTAHIPYGNRTIEDLHQIADDAVSFLLNQSVELIILACHTLSAVTYQYLKKRYPGVMIVSMIDLVAHQAALVTKNNNIGLLATVATVQSDAYKNYFSKNNPLINLVSEACPDLAGMIEIFSSKESDLKILIKKHCASLKHADVDTVILGSTHYSFVEHLIQKELGPQVICVSAETVFKNITPSIDEDYEPSISFFVTGNVSDFTQKILSIEGFRVTPRVIQSVRF